MNARAYRFHLLFGAVAALLVAGIALGFWGQGPWAWTIGLAYIAYDSWLLLFMVRESRRALSEQSERTVSEDVSRLTVVICARNERLVLPACLAALHAQTAAVDEVIVVDDGSHDGSVAWLRETYALDVDYRSAHRPGFRLLARSHEGKARALNAGWRLASGDLVVTLDADTVLDSGAIAAVRQAFALDRSLAAACGVLTPACRPGRWARAFEFYQTFEYLRGFLWRLAWMRRDMLLLISGAFAAYRKETLEALGGFHPESLVEDYDFIYRLHRHSGDQGLGWKTAVIAGARAVTDVPSVIPTFLHQRTRWFAGYLETLFRNRDMVGSARYGRVGRLMLPLKVVDSLLPIYALLAAALLVFFLVMGKHFDRVILIVIAAKFAFDLVFHCIAIVLYQRWQGIPLTNRLWARSLLATLTEPFCFQLLRHAGAALGWVAFLRGRIHWAPQRQPSPFPETTT